MSTGASKSPAELFDDFIKLEWQDIFRTEVHVKLDNGARYVPNGGAQGVQLLRKNVNAFEAAIRIWSGPTGEPDSGTQGYDRIVDQAGIAYTWEWFLIDPSRPWSSAVPALVRERIEADLARRDESALARAQARAKDVRHAADAADDKVIAEEQETCRARQESAQRATRGIRTGEPPPRRIAVVMPTTSQPAGVVRSDSN